MNNNRKFYVYAHYRSDGRIFYVGKGHGKRALSDKNRNRIWNAIAAQGWSSKTLVSNISEYCALSIERIFIAIHRPMLCNLTDGGQGVSGLKHSEQTKQKLRARAAAQWASPAAIERRRLATLAQWQEPGMRERFVNASNKRWQNPEQREAISRVQTGRIQSPEWAAKSRTAKLGKPVTEETRARLRASWVIRKARQNES